MKIYNTQLHILPKDDKTHIKVSFDVPSGLKRICVHTAYAPKFEYDELSCIESIDKGLATQDIAQVLTYEDKRRCIPLANHIAWSLHDGEKNLGTEHRHSPDQTHIISEKYSSNGFITAPIRQGKWTLTASINGIVTRYIDISVEVEGYEEDLDYPTFDGYGEESISNDSEDGKLTWQRVEMHCHTVASDGDMQPKELVQNAIKRGYKAICLTDHNTTANVNAVKKYGEEYGLVVAGGIEWTTFWGHMTVIGQHSDIDWKSITPSNINAKIIRARQLGDIVTVAHPKRIGSPLCMGCHNRFKITNWDYVTSYEVWSHYNPNVAPANKYAKQEWISLLDKGYKLCALYGYDWHAPDEGGPSYAYTYLGVNGRLSQKSICDAVEWGRSYITMGYEVDVSLSDGKNTYGIGDEIKVGRYTICIKAKKCEDYQYDSVLEKIVIAGNACDSLTLNLVGGEAKSEIFVGVKGYLRVEGIGKTQGEEADVFIASPIYIREV
ncbi:MAG: CehA/McbA family metallohydrolase [Clostridia bacterium]|nr:CehA/McbA family metallohydrolase [Clostridia bacterium]